MSNAEKIEEFLTTLYQTPDGKPTPTTQRLRLVLTKPLTTAAAIRYVVNLPVVNISIPETEKPEITWLFDKRRPWDPRNFISSYIELPSPLHLYWQGQAKQNLRKATNRALSDGFKVRLVETSEASAVIAQVFEDKGRETHEMLPMQNRLRESHENDFCVAVFDGNGHAVAFCMGSQAGNAVRNFWANTSLKGHVRWLCFTGFVEETHERGIRFIVESAPWAMSAGNRLFAHRLGFVPARMRIARSPEKWRRNRRFGLRFPSDSSQLKRGAQGRA